MHLGQFIPPECCADCDVCCRFLDEETPLAPVGPSLIPYKDLSLPPSRDRFICANFDPAANRCKDYDNRPLDCQLYPFVLMWDEGYRNIVLGLDHRCPYAAVIARRPEGDSSPVIARESRRDDRSNLYDGLGTGSAIPLRLLRTSSSQPSGLLRPFRARNDSSSKYILRFQDDIEILEKINIEVKPTLNKLLIGDKGLFEKYSGQNDRPVSGYSFIANYVWTGLLGYYWMVIDGNFCLFCKTKDTLFMPIPPLGKRLSRKAAREGFALMNRYNKNRNCSRIEDVTRDNVEFFEDLGYKVRKKGCEYIYRREDLANLAGDRYKAKRALCNYFEKNYRFRIKEFEPVDKEGCLALLKRWAEERQRSHKEDYYRTLIEDSYVAHKKAMDRFRDLGLIGRVVIVDGRLAAYTFGYGLDEETFVILFEVADLRFKGLAQFIFREFCRAQARFKYVNVMDDSGLETLKRTKMSYHPFKIEKTFYVYESR